MSTQTTSVLLGDNLPELPVGRKISEGKGNKDLAMSSQETGEKLNLFKVERHEKVEQIARLKGQASVLRHNLESIEGEILSKESALQKLDEQIENEHRRVAKITALQEKRMALTTELAEVDNELSSLEPNGRPETVSQAIKSESAVTAPEPNTSDSVPNLDGLLKIPQKEDDRLDKQEDLSHTIIEKINDKTFASQPQHTPTRETGTPIAIKVATDSYLKLPQTPEVAPDPERPLRIQGAEYLQDLVN